MSQITEAYAREMAKQEARKQALRAEIESDLSGVERIVFEAGCGHGHWLSSYAEANRDQHCIGIDLISWRIRKGLDKKKKRGLRNLHFYKAELGEFLEVMPGNIRFDCVILLFPDPWPKARHHRRRMVQSAFLDEVARRTDAGGAFCFRSDDQAYFDWTVEHLQAHPAWEIDPEASWPHETETYFQEMMETYYSVIAQRVGSESDHVQPD